MATTDSTKRVPQPAHPHKRRQPLPWHRPKAESEDVEAPARLKRILESPSYRQADKDVDFLNRDDTRGVRLQIDYLKAELLLEQEGIGHTIVVFGSTRICEPAQAQREVDSASAAFEKDPDNPDSRQRLEVARRVHAKSHYYEVARGFGRLVGAAGGGPHGKRLVMVTGGGPGIMEAANRGAHDEGAKSIGLNITLPHEQFPNPYVTPDLCFMFHYFALRKLHFLLRARALVAFPGGYGTLDELFETLTLIQTRKIQPLPIILVGRDYWQRVFDPDFLVEEGTIDAEDRELFWFAETADEIWGDILHWYNLAGRPFIP